MDSITASPGKYIQGQHVLSRAGHYLKPLGQHFLVLADSFVADLVEEKLRQTCEEHQIDVEFALFGGQCSQAEIDQLCILAQRADCDAILGIGGGKTLDTAKAVACLMKIPMVIAPTVASSDAPCSALSVIYCEDGSLDRYLPLPHNPDLVLVDSAIIAGAPPRLLAAGIGDALSTWFEARACAKSGAKTSAGGLPGRAALALAELCYHTLLEYGSSAIAAVQQRSVNTALEHVIEANIYLSGIGFESGGLAAAHAIHNGLTTLPDTQKTLHGEKVAFGTRVQLILEDASQEEQDRVLNLCRQAGLPVTLDELGITQGVEEKVLQVAQASCQPDNPMHNMPCKITAQQVYDAILLADEFGRKALASS
ncbi:glycerol dehydrogenase [Mangrovibacter yixingensis]|uniref:glycerol dehydrogenase n=1 Tax=Mangrovibacter yixingensis TaxID=1529639 RepID=UPI001CFE5E51|nr:glycerol dehydrogenase [Mangrovibacter yixingensis]